MEIITFVRIAILKFPFVQFTKKIDIFNNNFTLFPIIEGIHIDMSNLNDIHLTNRYPYESEGPVLIIGPGSTWGAVLKKFLPDRYTMVHGVCTGVGVGGFL